MENFGKTAVFPGGYGRIGEIPHGRIWPDWGLSFSFFVFFLYLLNIHGLG